MSITTVCLLAALCAPQGEGRKGRLVLPPPLPVQEQPVVRKQLSVAERFQRDVFKLRRTAALSSGAQELLLKQIAADYPNRDELALQFARRAKPDAMHGVLLVLRRWGNQAQAEELLFMLLTRPFGSATAETVDVMAELSGTKAKAALLSCCTARYSQVRKAATDQLLSRIDQDDLPKILELSRNDDEDVRRKALFLLGALPYPDSAARLIEALSDPDPTIAATACSSLIDHGPGVVPQLQEIVAHPAMDRSFGYAAFALAMLEDSKGAVYLTDAMLPNLRAELTGHDDFTRATSAVALANMAFRSEDTRGVEYGDRDIVEGLMLVVAPRSYVSSLGMLQPPATAKLIQFTGVDFRGRNSAWHAWWEKERDGFIGTRLRVPVTAQNAGKAVVEWTGVQRVLRFRGEEVPPLPADPDQRVDDFRLASSEMATLVAQLEQHGFMTQDLLARAADTEMLPTGRILELRLGSSRSRVSGPATPARWLDGLEDVLNEAATAQRWQLYADPDVDSKAFWQAERTWLAAHPDPVERARRLKDRILKAYPTLDEAARQRAMRHMVELPHLRQLLDEHDGMLLAELIEKSPRLDERTFDLVEVSLLAPGDRVWRRVLSAVDGHWDTGGRKALPKVFSLLGADAVRMAIADSRPRIRVAAIMEAANLRELAAVPNLRQAMEAPDTDVAQAAIYCLGVLGADEARQRLFELEASPDTSPATRRVVWVALARLGGEKVFPILQSAVASPRQADQLAAIQALGELHELRAAHFLAQILVAHGTTPRGTQALASLQKMGGLLARPALRRHLSVRDPAVRNEIVMALAEMEDVSVIPDLIPMLEQEKERARVAVLLSNITGLDLLTVNDRVKVIKEWWRTNKDLPQAKWFLDALARADVSNTLELRQLAPGSGNAAVPELTRIMLSAEKPFLRVMAAALLRDTTRREFGAVTVQSTPDQLRAIADRYRFYAAADADAEARRK